MVTLGVFLTEVKLGNNLKQMHLKGQSLQDYADLENCYLEHVMAWEIPLYNKNSLPGKVFDHSFPCQQIGDRQNWTVPNDKKSPIQWQCSRHSGKNY